MIETQRRTNAPYEPVHYPDLPEPWRGLLARFLRFCEKIKIPTKEAGEPALILWDSQRYMLEEIFDGFRAGTHDFVCLKGRQLGISTLLWAFDLFWLTTFTLQAIYIADDEGNKEIHRDILGQMYVSLPAAWSRGPWRQNNRWELNWSDRPRWTASRMMWAFANRRKEGQLGRSRGANYIHAEELDSWEDRTALGALTSARSETHPRRAYFWVGTGQGYGQLYELWDQAEHGVTSRAIFIGFWRRQANRVTREQKALWDAYGAPRPTPEEREWGEEVRRRYGYTVHREQLAWWRYTKAEGKGINGDEAKMLQEHPWCLSGATRVSTSRGIIPLAEAVAGDSTESGEALGVYPQGAREVVRATTRDGRVLVGTADHPMETPDGGIVRLGESQGRLLPLRAPRFSDERYRMRWELFGQVRCEMEVDETWGRFLGYFAGDGCYHNGYLSITCNAKDTDVVEDAKSLMVRLFGGAQERLCGRKRGNPERLGWIELRRGCAEFPALAKRLGIWKDDKPHRRVCVPEAIFRSPQTVIREFLRGLFEADGFNAYHARRVSLFSKWPQFLRDVQLLLLGFGITSRIKHEPKIIGGKTHGGYALGLRSQEAALFNERIGFVGQRKRLRDDHKPLWTRRSLPIEMTDEVVAVESVGAEMVYDITIADRHTFSANGFVSHNCPEQSFQSAGSAFMGPTTSLRLRTRLRDAPPAQTYQYHWGEKFDSKLEDVLVPAPAEAATLRIWEEPEPGMVYVLGADPSYGSSPDADLYAATVWKCFPDALVQVAEYATPLGAMYQFAWVLAHLAGRYRVLSDDHLILEIGGPGRAVHEELERMASYGYGMTQHSEDLQQVLGQIQHFLYRRVDSMSGQMAWHFNTTTETRIQIMEQLRDTAERGALVVRSKDLVEQLAALRRQEDSGRIEPGGIAKDDLAFTAALAVHCWLQNVIPEIEDAVAPLKPAANAPRHTGESMLRTFLGGLRQQERPLAVTSRPRAPGR